MPYLNENQGKVYVIFSWTWTYIAPFKKPKDALHNGPFYIMSTFNFGCKVYFEAHTFYFSLSLVLATPE